VKPEKIGVIIYEIKYYRNEEVYYYHTSLLIIIPGITTK